MFNFGKASNSPLDQRNEDWRVGVVVGVLQYGSGKKRPGRKHIEAETATHLGVNMRECNGVADDELEGGHSCEHICDPVMVSQENLQCRGDPKHPSS
jgi:hypothetical protein